MHKLTAIFNKGTQSNHESTKYFESYKQLTTPICLLRNSSLLTKALRDMPKAVF